MMTPIFFVFCEGETEVAYIELLRSYYRLPIHIVPIKTLQNITPALIERHKAEYVQTKRDRTYLMYDLDVQPMLGKLRKLKDSVLLCSNPCFELWLLLHYESLQKELTSAECVKRLGVFVKQYRKGLLNEEVKQHLMENVSTAVERAKKMPAYLNPSTTVYLLVDDLNELKKRKDG